MVQGFHPHSNNNDFIQLTDDGVRISANAKTDWFFHPNEKTQRSIVPSLTLETSESVISITAQVCVNLLEISTIVAVLNVRKILLETESKHLAARYDPIRDQIATPTLNT